MNQGILGFKSDLLAISLGYTFQVHPIIAVGENPNADGIPYKAIPHGGGDPVFGVDMGGAHLLGPARLYTCTKNALVLKRKQRLELGQSHRQHPALLGQLPIGKLHINHSLLQGLQVVAQALVFPFQGIVMAPIHPQQEDQCGDENDALEGVACPKV